MQQAPDARKTQPIMARILLASWDVLSWGLAAVLYALLRFGEAELEMAPHLLEYTAMALCLQLGTGLVLRLYTTPAQAGTFEGVTSAATSAAITGVLAALITSLAFGRVSRLSLVAVPATALALMLLGRWLVRTQRVRHHRRSRTVPDAPLTLIYGAGMRGRQVAELNDRESAPPYRLVGYVDDNPTKKHARIFGYRVLGRGEALEEIISTLGVEQVILASMALTKPSSTSSRADAGRWVRA